MSLLFILLSRCLILTINKINVYLSCWLSLLKSSSQNGKKLIFVHSIMDKDGRNHHFSH